MIGSSSVSYVVVHASMNTTLERCCHGFLHGLFSAAMCCIAVGLQAASIRMGTLVGHRFVLTTVVQASGVGTNRVRAGHLQSN